MDRLWVYLPLAPDWRMFVAFLAGRLEGARTLNELLASTEEKQRLWQGSLE